METKNILDAIEEIRQIALSLNEEIGLDQNKDNIKNTTPEIILKLQTLALNINNQANLDMKNEMPKTDREWFASLDMNVKVYGEMELLDQSIMFQGRIASVSPGKGAFTIRNENQNIGACAFKMISIKLFEFVEK